MSKKQYDMTQGNIWKALVTFALPLLGGSLFQQLYNTADMIFVGNFVNKSAAAAVGASSLLFACLIGLFTGVSVGTGVVVAQKIGAKDMESAHKASHTAIYFSILGGVVITIIGILFSEKLLLLINTPMDILLEADIYLKIYFLSIIPMILYNMGSGIIRATGDSKTPFQILIIGGIVNVLANAFFIILMKLGVLGVAIATCISQLLTAFLVLRYLFRNKSIIKIEKSKLKIDNTLLKNILYLGLPAGIQSMIMTFSNIIVQYYINGYGKDAIAAYAFYFKLENFIWMPIVALGQATTTFVGQNTGARDFDRVKKGTINSVLLSGSVAITVASIILLFPTFFFRIFTSEMDVIDLGRKIIFISFPFYWFYSILETMGGSLRGMGYSIVTMIISVSTMSLFRILVLYILGKYNLEYYQMAVVYPITWGLSALSLTMAFIILLKKKRKN